MKQDAIRILKSKLKSGSTLQEITKKTKIGYGTIWRLLNQRDSNPTERVISKILKVYRGK